MNSDNYQFHYSLSGSTDKPLALFLHGFMGASHDFDEVISLLSDQFCCLAVDLPGHGKTLLIGGDECYSMPSTAQALINLLNQLNIEKCFLVGYSMGGRLALYLTIQFPQRFSKVVLESASPGLKTQQERMERIQHDFKLAQNLETRDFSSFLSSWYNQPLFASLKQHHKFEHVIERRLENNPIELAKSLRNMSTGAQPSLWDKLKQNKIPLLLIVGKYDHKFRAINWEMAELCEAAILEIVSCCGHNVNIEMSEIFIEKLTLFLVD